MAASVLTTIDSLFEGVAIAAEASVSLSKRARKKGEEGTLEHNNVVPHSVEIERFAQAVESDIRCRPATSWKKLDARLKWTALRRFLEARDAKPDAYKLVADLLHAKELQAVDYDPVEQRVLRIRHPSCDALDELEPVVTDEADDVV